jgi:hypothetical protein
VTFVLYACVVDHNTLCNAYSTANTHSLHIRIRRLQEAQRKSEATSTFLGNFRKQFTHIVKDQIMQKWSKSKSQANFASSAAFPFVSSIRLIIASGDLQHRHLAFAMRLLADSVQFTIEQDGDAREFVEKKCSLCDSKAIVDVHHLFTCANAEAIQRRQVVVSRLMAMLETARCSPHWLDTFSSASFVVVIRNMFSAWNNRFENDDARCLRSAFGCFSPDEFSEAMSAVGVVQQSEWPWLEAEIRRLLLSSAYKEWRLRSGLQDQHDQL